MELSQEAKQRRAEEIYYRRRNSLNLPKTTTVNVNPKKNYKLLKKILVQVIVCASIYGVIYKLQSNTDAFSIDSINYLKNTMSYDININTAFENIKNYMSTYKSAGNQNEVNNIIENTDEEVIVDNEVKEATLSASEQIVENTNNQEDQIKEEASSVSQMEEDANYIKNNYSLIKPLTGTITSRFGLRNPTTATVPKYHTGIDIAVVEGTVFVSAMEGTVELVSSYGDYRKPCKNNKWRSINTLCAL